MREADLVVVFVVAGYLEVLVVRSGVDKEAGVDRRPVLEWGGDLGFESVPWCLGFVAQFQITAPFTTNRLPNGGVRGCLGSSA